MGGQGRRPRCSSNSGDITPESDGTKVQREPGVPARPSADVSPSLGGSLEGRRGRPPPSHLPWPIAVIPGTGLMGPSTRRGHRDGASSEPTCGVAARSVLSPASLVFLAGETLARAPSVGSHNTSWLWPRLWEKAWKGHSCCPGSWGFPTGRCGSLYSPLSFSSWKNPEAKVSGCPRTQAPTCWAQSMAPLRWGHKGLATPLPQSKVCPGSSNHSSSFLPSSVPPGDRSAGITSNAIGS